MLNNKYILIVLSIVIFTSGMFTHYKLERPVECPKVEIPPCPACPDNVTVQQLDMSAIRKVKGDFIYSPTFQGTITIAKEDTIKIKKK